MDNGQLKNRSGDVNVDFGESVVYLSNLKKSGINLGLARIEKLCEKLGNPQDSLKVVHIAGTNGKGSTAAFLSSILIAQGYKVGVFTSPYLLSYREMFRINGIEISECRFGKIIEEVLLALNKNINNNKEHPTEFEFVTAAAFQYFKEENVDFAIIETGVGGRSDSTNIVKPVLSIITSVSYDHIALLGDTLESIAYEKAGIIKETVPVVVYPQEDRVIKVITDECNLKKSSLIEVPRNCTEFVGMVNDNTIEQKFNILYNDDNYEIITSLLGRHQMLNCAAAVYAANELIRSGFKIEKGNMITGIRSARWPGRMEVLNKEPVIIIDGAHNMNGILSLKASIKEYLKYEKLYLILGILADKQVEDIVSLIVDGAEMVCCVTPHSERAKKAEDLESIVKKYNKKCSSFNDYRQAFHEAVKFCSKNDMILICGSLYMIGYMRKIVIDELKV